MSQIRNFKSNQLHVCQVCFIFGSGKLTLNLIHQENIGQKNTVICMILKSF